MVSHHRLHALAFAVTVLQIFPLALPFSLSPSLPALSLSPQLSTSIQQIPRSVAERRGEEPEARKNLMLRGGGEGVVDGQLEGFDKLGIGGEGEEGEKKSFNIVLVGHVDAGKSTISGQLLYCSGMLDERTLEKYEREAKNLGRESWKFAWAMDQTEEERARGKTHELGTAEFETEKRRYTILDAPGHKSFVPEMIGGASQADAAVMVISARTGEFEAGFEKGGQTREHAILVKTLGVQSLIVAVNKMDEVAWSEVRFSEIQTKFSAFLSTLGFSAKKDVTFVPVSGLHCLNFNSHVPAETCPWFAGPTLVQALDAVEVENRATSEGLPLRMPVTDKYRDSETFVMGKVECGSVSKGDVVRLMPEEREMTIAAVIVNSREVLAAHAGQLARLKVKGIDDEHVHVGDVVTARGESGGMEGTSHGPVSRFEAKVNLLECKSIVTSGYQCMLHIHALETECSFGELKGLVAKKKDAGKPAVKPKFLRQGQTASLDILLNSPVFIDRYKDAPQLGRFVLRDEGVTVGVGIVTELFES